MIMMQTILVVLFVALMLYGAWSDARTLRIPNALSLVLLGIFFPTAVIAGLPLENIAWHVLTAVVVLAAGIILFALGLFGGGDAKLLAASALWVGWPLVMWMLIAVIIVGGVLSVVVILLRKGLGLWPDWLVRTARGVFEPGKAVPYGIAITIGTLMVMPRMDVVPTVVKKLFAFVAG